MHISLIFSITACNKYFGTNTTLMTNLGCVVVRVLVAVPGSQLERGIGIGLTSVVGIGLTH